MVNGDPSSKGCRFKNYSVWLLTAQHSTNVAKGIAEMTLCLVLICRRINIVFLPPQGVGKIFANHTGRRIEGPVAVLRRARGQRTVQRESISSPSEHRVLLPALGNNRASAGTVLVLSSRLPAAPSTSMPCLATWTISESHLWCHFENTPEISRKFFCVVCLRWIVRLHRTVDDCTCRFDIDWELSCVPSGVTAPP